MMTHSKMQVTFSISGTITQEIELFTNLYDIEDVQTMLNNGELLTTIQDDGDIVISNNFEVIGVVNEVNSDAEYFDFEVEEQ